MQSLASHRYTAKEIGAYLSKLGHKTSRGGYSPRLVGATLLKLWKRMARRRNTQLSVSKATFYLETPKPEASS